MDAAVLQLCSGIGRILSQERRGVPVHASRQKSHKYLHICLNNKLEN